MSDESGTDVNPDVRFAVYWRADKSLWTIIGVNGKRAVPLAEIKTLKCLQIVDEGRFADAMSEAFDRGTFTVNFSSPPPPPHK